MMNTRYIKSLPIIFISLLFLSISNISYGQEEHTNEGSGKFDPGALIIEHISDNHDFHFFDWKGHPVAAPLPVILYSAEKGFSSFMSLRFKHGKATYNGYKLVHNHVVAVNEDQTVNAAIKVYDFSLTRNVVQMLLALAILVWIMVSVAAKYKRNGHAVAPSGMQNAVEPVITFIRDEVAKVNLGRRYQKYMPYLLTIFFFILINNVFGLIPGTANVTGNIAFTMVLAVISLVVILLSSNGHFWGHIFWPPGVPFLVKLILIPVEFAGIFIKPLALMIRLFANMIAGHIVITCFIML
ncbi:MAG: F0F1 ATP synthase subunit A, partial [Chitinophagaceae bacterium]